MARESGVALEKVTMNLYEGDKDFLISYYSALGWSVAARRIIHKHCRLLREKDSQEVMANAKILDIEMPSLEDLKEA